jgi:hypothetical protein
MTLDELLSELRENILHDRSDRVEGTPDLLWSDATLIRYINESERRFARRGLVLHDAASPEATQVTLVEGQTLYPLHASVLAVITAKLAGEPRDLSRTGHAAIDGCQMATDIVRDASYVFELAPGKPVAYTTDESISLDDSGTLQSVTLRVYPAPTAEYADQIINLRVMRLPLERFVLDDLGQDVTPEIPEDHHLEMLDWAAYLALRIVDVDAGLPDRAAEFRASFEAHVKQARVEALRKLFVPQTWGFGQNGFRWER